MSCETLINTKLYEIILYTQKVKQDTSTPVIKPTMSNHKQALNCCDALAQSQNFTTAEKNPY